MRGIQATGDKVDEGDVVCDIEFEEFTIGLSSPYNGFLASIEVRKIPVPARPGP